MYSMCIKHVHFCVVWQLYVFRENFSSFCTVGLNEVCVSLCLCARGFIDGHGSEFKGKGVCRESWKGKPSGSYVVIFFGFVSHVSVCVWCVCVCKSDLVVFSLQDRDYVSRQKRGRIPSSL